MSSTERAISPIISVTLMVAIVVVLAGTVSVFVLGLGETVGDPAPSTALEVEKTENGTVELAHVAGETLVRENLGVNGGEIRKSEMPERIDAGTTIDIDPDRDADEITVTWEKEGQSAVLLREPVSVSSDSDGAVGAGEVLILQTEDGDPLAVGDTYNTTADPAESPVIQVPSSASESWDVDMTTDLGWDPSETRKAPGERATVPDWMLGFAVPEQGEIVGVTENEADNEFLVEVATCRSDC